MNPNHSLDVDLYGRKAQQMRSEAISRMFRSAFAALRRLFVSSKQTHAAQAA